MPPPTTDSERGKKSIAVGNSNQDRDLQFLLGAEYRLQ
jgi:hypothetical protein